MMLLSFILQLLGLWLLSMAMNKHYRYTFLNALTSILERIFTVLGYSGIIISFYLICLLEPLPLMIVYWIAYLAFNITLVALLNSFQESRYKKRAS